MNTWYILIFIFKLSFSQNLTNNGGKSYFFKMGKNTNEFRVNNRIMYLNHNITDEEYPILEKKRAYVTHSSVEKTTLKFAYSYYLDDEWNYNHNNNLNKTQIPVFVNRFYDELVAEPDSTATSRILFNLNRNNSNPILQFNLDMLDPQETIVDAGLFIYWPLKNTSKIFNGSVVLKLYQLEKQINSEINKTELIQNPDVHKLFNIVYVLKAQKAWHKFIVKKPLENWLVNGEVNLGLFLTISSYDTNELLEVFNDTNTGNFTTFMIVKIQKNDSQSEYNETTTRDLQTLYSPCQRENWTINFKTMGWNKFIILPEEFSAYDCIGKCTKPLENDTNHGKFLYMFQKRSSCCVPTRFLPLPIMYFDKYGDIALKNYKNAIVANCGCR